MRHFSASLQALAAGALFLTTGCSPSVYTSIQKSYPARIEGSTVLVYDMADSLPEPAEILGSVTVKDSGFSVNCNYAKVMQRAKDETNKIGGNGLHLFWHKEPSALGSSCHRIAAHMLLLPDSVYTASYFDNVAAQNARLAAYGLIPADGTVAPGRETPKAANNNTLTFNAGYAFITSDFYLPAGVSGNPKQGLDINAAYQWTSRIGIGFGLADDLGVKQDLLQLGNAGVELALLVFRLVIFAVLAEVAEAAGLLDQLRHLVGTGGLAVIQFLFQLVIPSLAHFEFLCHAAHFPFYP